MITAKEAAHMAIVNSPLHNQTEFPGLMQILPLHKPPKE